MTSSSEMLVLCNEAVGIIKHYLKGIEITPETLALDVIKKVGPGGNFFSEKHTFTNFKKHLFFSELLNRSGHDNWQEAAGTSFEQRANQKVREILKNHVVTGLPKEVVANIKEIVARRDSEVNAQISNLKGSLPIFF